MRERSEFPRGRAVGDEDATSGPMDDLPPGLVDESGKAAIDTVGIEEDRARSSGRPPLAAEAAAHDRKARASPCGARPAPRGDGYLSKPQP